MNNQIQVNWNTFTIDNGQVTEVFRDNNLLISIPGNSGNYVDSTVTCKTNYCYSLRTSYPNGSVSNSNVSCDSAFSTDQPGPVVNISSIHSGGQIAWNWQVPSGVIPATYHLNLTSSLGLNIKTDTSLLNQYISITQPDSMQCLQITIDDSCGNESAPGIKACSMVVQGTPETKGAVQLNWNAYSGWSMPPTEYYVVIYDEFLVVVDSISVGQATDYLETVDQAHAQVSNYAIWAISSDPLITNSRSNVVKVIRDPVISVPNAFTPNGDNMNDSFLVSGRFLQKVEITVFNRWGETVFKTDDENGWDGKLKDKVAPVGNYIYKVNVEDSAGIHHERTGTVLLLKK